MEIENIFDSFMLKFYRFLIKNYEDIEKLQRFLKKVLKVSYKNSTELIKDTLDDNDYKMLINNRDQLKLIIKVYENRIKQLSQK